MIRRNLLQNSLSKGVRKTGFRGQGSGFKFEPLALPVKGADKVIVRRLRVIICKAGGRKTGIRDQGTEIRIRGCFGRVLMGAYSPAMRPQL